MKKVLIILVVIATVLLLILGISSCTKSKETQQPFLSIQTTYTEIIVKDDSENIITNGSKIKVGEDYTITFIENTDYVLESFTINGTDFVNYIENNQYTFTCTGSTIINVVSIESTGGDVMPDTPPLEGADYLIRYISLQRTAMFLSDSADIDLVVYKADNTFFTRLSPGDYFYAPEGSNFKIKFEIMTPNCSVMGLGYKYSSSLFEGFKAFPIIAENVSQNINLYVHYYKASISTINPSISSDVAGIPIQITTLTGDYTCDLEIGQQYKLVDTCNPGYKSILYVNGQATPLPYTFTYTKDFDFDVEVVQRTGAFVTLPANFVPTFVLTQGTVTEYLSWSGNDGEMRFEDLSEYIGWNLSLRVKYPPYGYDQLSFRLNGGESTTEYNYGQITTGMFENFVLEPGIIPSPPTDVG